MRLHLLLILNFILIGGLISALGFAVDISHCEYDKECVVDLPGAKCADGTQSFFTLTKQRGAKDLLIYLSGGGACWSKETCERGLASPLTRVEPNNDWINGTGIQDRSDASNPFRNGFNVVHVPYCTGDVYSGDRVANYQGRLGSEQRSMEIQHRGYNNIQRILTEVRGHYPSPERAVLLGCSAGGIGVSYHLRNFSRTFEDSKRYVINDAGTPFIYPHLYEASMKRVYSAWGMLATLPSLDLGNVTPHLGHVAEYNTKEFQDVRFGFISSYRDSVMGFFSMMVGSPDHLVAVKNMIIDVADNYLGREAKNQKVFFTESYRHCHTPTALGSIKSMNTDLGTWLTQMVNDDTAWASVRPDLHRPVLSSREATSDPRPKTLEDLKRLLSGN